MPHTVARRVAEWSRSTADADLALIHELVTFLAEKRFAEYLPTRTGPHASFLIRLRDWLNAAPDEAAQKTLLRLVPHLFFVGSDEFDALYRDAYLRLIQPWIFDQITPNFDEPGVDAVLQVAIDGTWFCPITDSLNINAFCKANGIVGPALRPTWRSLVELGKSPADQKAYMTREHLRRIVLLEDFVGSGEQIAPAVALADQVGVPVLVLPLVTCPAGATAGRDWQAKLLNITFAPCLEIREEHFIAKMPRADESAFYATVRDLVRALDSRVKGSGYNKYYYGPLGFNHTGGLVVLFSNTPDNTLPVIHWQSDSWSPLFPRVARGT